MDEENALAEPVKYLVFIEAHNKVAKINGIIAALKRQGTGPKIAGPGYTKVLATGGHFRSLASFTPFFEPPGDEVNRPVKDLPPSASPQEREFIQRQINDFLTHNPPATRLSLTVQRSKNWNPDPEANPARYLGMSAPVPQGLEKFLSAEVRGRAPFTPWYWYTSFRTWTAIHRAVEELAPDGEIYLATDDDEEGEGIAWHLVTTLKLAANGKALRIRRVRYKAVALPEVKEGFEAADAGEPIKLGLAFAQQTREMLDLAVGFCGSRAIWTLGRFPGTSGLSIGRVQLAAMNLMLDSEEALLQSLPAISYNLKLTGTAKGQDFGLSWSSQQPVAALANTKELIAKLASGPGVVAKLTREEQFIPRPNLYDLNQLQNDAYRVWRMSAKDVLDIGQALYSSGVCFPAGTLVACVNGQTKPIEHVVVGDEICAFDQARLVGQEAKVTQVFKRQAGRLVRLRCERNEEVSCTPEHPFMRLTSSGPQWTHASDLRVGDFIASAAKLETAWAERPISLLAVDLDPRMRVLIAPEAQEKVRAAVFQATTGQHRWMASRWMGWYGEATVGDLKTAISLGLLDVGWATNQIRHLRCRNGKFGSLLEMPDGWLPSRFWYLVGLFLGDGSYVGHARVSFPHLPHEKYDKPSFDAILNDCGWSSPIYAPKDKDHRGVIKLGASLSELVARAGGRTSPGAKSGNIRVPSLLGQSRHPDACAFLAGLWDSDGHVAGVSGRESLAVGYTSNSRRMLDDMRVLLRRFGIRGALHSRVQTGTYGSKNLSWCFRVSQYDLSRFGLTVAPWLRTRAEAWACGSAEINEPTTWIPNVVVPAFDDARVASGLTRQQVGKQTASDWWNFTKPKPGRNKPSQLNQAVAQRWCETISLTPTWLRDVCASQAVEWLEVLEVSDEAGAEVFDVSTTTETLNANGFFAHNCTYPRTDSDSISPSHLKSLHEFAALAGLQYEHKGVVQRGSAGAQGAHEAIIPMPGELATAYAAVIKAGLKGGAADLQSIQGAVLKAYRNGGTATLAERVGSALAASGVQGADPLDVLKIYDLVFRRSLAALMGPARVEKVRLVVSHPQLPKEVQPTTEARRVLDAQGYAFYTYPTLSLTRGGTLPDLKQGEPVQLKLATGGVKAEVRQDSRPTVEIYVREKLSGLGIGRPSSTADALNTLERRGYVAAQGEERHVLTRFGAFVTALTRHTLRGVVSLHTTSEMDRAAKKLREAKPDNVRELQQQALARVWNPYLFERLRETRLTGLALGQLSGPGLSQLSSFLPPPFSTHAGLVRETMQPILSVSANVDEELADVLAKPLPIKGPNVSAVLAPDQWHHWGSLRFLARARSDERGGVLAVWRRDNERYSLRYYLFYVNPARAAESERLKALAQQTKDRDTKKQLELAAGFEWEARCRCLMLTVQVKLAQVPAMVSALIGELGSRFNSSTGQMDYVQAWDFVLAGRLHLLKHVPDFELERNGLFVDMARHEHTRSVWMLTQRVKTATTSGPTVL